LEDKKRDLQRQLEEANSRVETEAVARAEKVAKVEHQGYCGDMRTAQSSFVNF